MPWVRFSKPFDFRVTKQATIHYKAGCEYLVKQRCVDEAVAQGKAELIERKDENARSR